MDKGHRKSNMTPKQRKDLYIQRNRDYVRRWKETHSCEVCSEARAVCLDFHHKYPANKSFEVSSGCKSKSIATLANEISKCMTVCANCHRVIHAETELEDMQQYEKLPLFE